MNTKHELITNKYLNVFNCGNNYSIRINKRQLPAPVKVTEQLNTYKHSDFIGIEDYLNHWHEDCYALEING